MHKFLRAIGFSEIKKEELEEVFKKIIEHPEYQKVSKDSEQNEFAELMYEFGDFFGLCLRGTFSEEDDEFHMDYYYPYLCGSMLSTREIPEIEKYAEKESYAGVCDDIRVGVTLIFYLQNVVDYLTEKNSISYPLKRAGVVFGALSTEGKILFPIGKNESQRRRIEQQKIERNHLIAAARKGDEDAIENLTLEDMDTYSLLSRRITHEDILSIVENYFMPYSVESDQYSILAEIIDWRISKNGYTQESIYVLDLLCNDIPFTLCINQKDLLGEPEVGRRFKGTVWMQGMVYYQN